MANILSFLRSFFAPRGSAAGAQINRPYPISPGVDVNKARRPREKGINPAPFGGTKPGQAVNFGRPQAPGEKRDYAGAEYLRDFLRNGAALFVSSSWVEYARYNPASLELEIGFKDGWVAFYGDCDDSWAISFAQAPSKGVWLHTNIKAGYAADGKHWIHAKPYRHG